MASEVPQKPISPPAAEIIPARAAVLALIALLLAGFAVRWVGVGEQSLTHPEAYVPGIGISEETRVPPPRHEFWETLNWHFHDEPHPVGYYMSMFAWTSVVGDSETALRTPSVLFGAGSIALIYALGAALYGRVAGLASAALLAFNGFHIFWSGIARMYAPGCFFGLLATWLLVQIVSNGRRGRLAGAGYVASILAATQTTELNWALFAAHVLWAAWVVPPQRASGKLASTTAAPIIVLQVAAFLLAAPGLLHAVYTARGGAADEPSIAFAWHYFTFGFLLEPDTLAEPARAVNPVVVAAAFVFSLALAGAGLARRTFSPPASPPRSIPLQAMAAVALASAGFMFWLSTIAEKRGAALAIISLLPILALTWPYVAGSLRVGVRRAAPAVEAAISRVDPFALLIGGLGVLAPLAIIILSLWKPVTESRPFIVFIPYLAILAGAGFASLRPRPSLLAGASVALAALLAVSVVHSAKRVTSPRDYKGLAAAIGARAKEGDLFFIRRWEWRDAPATYYLPHAGIVGDNFADRLGAARAARIWTIEWFDDEDSNADRLMAAALDSFVPCEKVKARGGAATLYVRRAAAGACAAAAQTRLLDGAHRAFITRDAAAL